MLRGIQHRLLQQDDANEMGSTNSIKQTHWYNNLMLVIFVMLLLGIFGYVIYYLRLKQKEAAETNASKDLTNSFELNQQDAANNGDGEAYSQTNKLPWTSPDSSAPDTHTDYVGGQLESSA